MKYAVVSWYNYDAEKQAGFLKGFDDFEEARKFAYRLAEEDIETYTDEHDEVPRRVITEQEITSRDGPGQGPYNSLIGYGGGGDPTGYQTEFYCVVEWFDGVDTLELDMDNNHDEDHPLYY